MSAFFSSQPGLAWHRSVYGRIALGYILLIALELAAQGAVFLWLVERRAQSNPSDLTQAFASQLAQALQGAPEANLAGP